MPAFLIVGIGASAGGLAAFKGFFAKMPADIGMAFILVQHLAPSHKSMLVELLRPHTPVPIIEAHDGVEVEKNHVYVIPPDATLTMDGMALRVEMPAPERPHRRPIDTLFSSLAENHTDCAVGIILSGVGSDGSLGVQAIKEHGGFTLAQAEFDATAMSGMPQSATATGSVDYYWPSKIWPANWSIIKIIWLRSKIARTRMEFARMPKNI
jgi:two-component system, chemotaxis family, CheB/CheR fusion protein